MIAVGFGLLVLGIASILVSSFTAYQVSGNWFGILILAISASLLASAKRKENSPKNPAALLFIAIAIAFIFSATIIHGDAKSWILIALSVLIPLVLLPNKE